jgi:hypothetical protein
VIDCTVTPEFYVYLIINKAESQKKIGRIQDLLYFGFALLVSALRFLCGVWVSEITSSFLTGVAGNLKIQLEASSELGYILLHEIESLVRHELIGLASLACLVDIQNKLFGRPPPGEHV